LATHFGLGEKGSMETDGLRDLSEEDEAKLAEYCDQDVRLTMKLYEKLEADFPASQYPYMDWTIRSFVNPKLILNVPVLQKCAEDEREEKKQKFEALGIDKGVFSSNDQFAELLRSRGYVVPTKPSPRKKNKDGTPAIIPAFALGDPQFLDILENGDETLRALCEARVESKSTQLETRSDKLAKIGPTGCWPFDMEFSGADQTHRISGGSGAGGNPLNFTACRDKEEHAAGHQCPGRLRAAVRTPEGYSLVVGDLAAIEMRLVAYLAGETSLIRDIENDIDTYCVFASAFYGRTITKDDVERKFGKTAILGLGYNMGAKKFKVKVRTDTGQVISDEDANKAVQMYRRRYPRIPATWRFLDTIIPRMADKNIVNGGWVGSMPVKYGFEYIELPDGLRMKYPNLRQVPGKKGPQWAYDKYEKGNLEMKFLYGGKLLENISQGLAGVLCREATEPFYHCATGSIYDEIHLVVKTPLAPLMAQKLKRTMSASPKWFRQIHLDAEVGYGPTWLGAK
jgi:hypothetical protein